MATFNGIAVLSFSFLLWFLLPFTGLTLAHAQGGTTSALNQSHFLGASCSWVCQGPLESFASTPPGWAESWLEESGGIPVKSRCPSPSFSPSQQFLIGGWLSILEHNGSSTLMVQLPDMLLQYMDGLIKSAQLTHDGLLTCWSTVMMMPSFCMRNFGNAVILLAECVENAITMWISSLALLLWQLAQISPRRTLTWMVVLSTSFYLWTNRIWYVILKTIFFPVWLPVVLFQKCLPTLLPFLKTSLSSNTSHSENGCECSKSKTKKKETKEAPTTLGTSTTSTSKKKERKMKTKERALSGFKPAYLPGTPPKGVIGEVLDEKRRRIGFFSCVKFICGGKALMTPVHVWKDAAYFQGPAGYIPKPAMEILGGSKSLDFVFFRGNGNWDSRMGMSARLLSTVDTLTRGQHVLYTYHDEVWKAQSASILEYDNGDVVTECLTKDGDSGLPIFDPRGVRIVAMHVGSFKDQENNRATAIPPIPGFTALDTQYFKPVESAYTDDTLVDLQEDSDGDKTDFIVGAKAYVVKTKKGGITIASLRDENWVPKTGKYWDDYLSDSDEESKNSTGLPQATKIEGQGTSSPTSNDVSGSVPLSQPSSPSGLYIPPQKREGRVKSEAERERRKRQKANRIARKTSESRPSLGSVEENLLRDLHVLSKKVESMISEKSRTRVQPSKNSSQGSTAGEKPNQRQTDSNSSAHARSGPSNVKWVASQSGAKAESPTRHSWNNVASSSVGPKPGLQQN